MKNKPCIVLCGGILLAFILIGCGKQSSQAGYIGVDAAKAIALTAAGTSETDAAFNAAELDERDGRDYYALSFTADGQSYQYDIDAITGAIISSSQTETDGGSGAASGTADSGAQAETGSDSGAASGTTDSGVQVTQGAGTEASGSDSSVRTEAGSEVITDAEAQAIALDHAGLTSDEVTFIKSKLERDDGRLVYDIEFYSSSRDEYDYTIEASTGSILSIDYDLNGYTPPADGSSAITADQAREIALEQVPGATVNDIYEFETDYDDGRLEYEGSILYDGTEYEFTIDGYSGAIREWEAERKR